MDLSDLDRTLFFPLSCLKELPKKIQSGTLANPRSIFVTYMTDAGDNSTESLTQLFSIRARAQGVAVPKALVPAVTQADLQPKPTVNTIAMRIAAVMREARRELGRDYANRQLER